MGPGLYLVGRRLYVLGRDLYLIGRDLYLDFGGKVLGPISQAQDFTLKIEVKMRAWIFGPTTLPHRHESLPHRHASLPLYLR